MQTQSDARRLIVRGHDVAIVPASWISGYMAMINPAAKLVRIFYAATPQEAEDKARAYCTQHPRQS